MFGCDVGGGDLTDFPFLRVKIILCCSSKLNREMGRNAECTFPVCLFILNNILFCLCNSVLLSRSVLLSTLKVSKKREKTNHSQKLRAEEEEHAKMPGCRREDCLLQVASTSCRCVCSSLLACYYYLSSANISYYSPIKTHKTKRERARAEVFSKLTLPLFMF